MRWEKNCSPHKRTALGGEMPAGDPVRGQREEADAQQPCVEKATDLRP